MKKGLYFTVLAAATLLFAGCVSGNSDIEFSPSDPAIARSNAKSVKIGKTTEDQLIGIMGNPSSRHTTDDGSEHLSYCYWKTTDSQFSAPFVNFHDEKEENLELTFTISNGVVTNIVSKPK